MNPDAPVNRMRMRGTSIDNNLESGVASGGLDRWSNDSTRVWWLITIAYGICARYCAH